MASLSSLVIAPGEPPHRGGGGKTSSRPINIVSAGTLAEGELAAAVRCEVIRPGSMEAGRSRHDDVVVGDARPAGGFRTEVEHRFRPSNTSECRTESYEGRW
jgi:hypothetical protein